MSTNTIMGTNETVGEIVKVTRVHVDNYGNKTERDLTPEELEQWKAENIENTEVER